jgi:hypothetical protein
MKQVSLKSYALSVDVTDLPEANKHMLWSQLLYRCEVQVDTFTDPRTKQEYMTVYVRLPVQTTEKVQADHMVSVRFDELVMDSVEWPHENSTLGA